MKNHGPKSWLDLHIHTTKSDGTFSPEQIIQLTARNNIRTIAITDHDTLAGLEEARFHASKADIRIIDGIEISAKCTDGILHVLGYGIDIHSHSLKKNLSDFQKIRKNRNLKIIEKLNQLGMEIREEEILKEAKSMRSLGRPHIASLLVRKGIVKNIKEAFEIYLGNGGQAFVCKEVFTARESIEMIRNAGGKAVLAHPSTIKLKNESLRQFILQLKEAGLNGVEVYSSIHTREEINVYLEICKELNLLVSAGSDFHGSNKDGVKIGICNDGGKVEPFQVSEELIC